MEAIQNYQQVEQQYRQKYKQRMERQFKIGESCFGRVVPWLSWLTAMYPVKPDATPEEIRAVVNDDSGGQIFSQAVCSRNICSDI